MNVSPKEDFDLFLKEYSRDFAARDLNRLGWKISLVLGLAVGGLYFFKPELAFLICLCSISLLIAGLLFFFKKKNIRPQWCVFELDKISKGQDLLPTLLENLPKTPLMEELLWERASKEIQRIRNTNPPNSPQIHFRWLFLFLGFQLLLIGFLCCFNRPEAALVASFLPKSIQNSSQSSASNSSGASSEKTEDEKGPSESTGTPPEASDKIKKDQISSDQNGLAAAKNQSAEGKIPDNRAKPDQKGSKESEQQKNKKEGSQGLEGKGQAGDKTGEKSQTPSKNATGERPKPLQKKQGLMPGMEDATLDMSIRGEIGAGEMGEFQRQSEFDSNGLSPQEQKKVREFLADPKIPKEYREKIKKMMIGGS